MTMREAVILAGGFGTRLRHVVSDVPKPMAPVCGRPFLSHLMDHLQTYGFDHIVLSTGYLHEKIEECYGGRYRDMEISYARETSPLGTGGAIVNALRHCRGDVVTVLNGDTLFRIDHDRLDRFFNQHNTRLAIVLRHVDDTSRYGAVRTDSTGRIVQFTEKSEAHGPGTINGGIYRLHRSLLEGFAWGEAFSFEKELMQVRYTQDEYYAYPADDYFIDIGVPDDYFKIQQDLQCNPS